MTVYICPFVVGSGVSRKKECVSSDTVLTLTMICRVQKLLRL
jgi:hypothetical protein